MGCCCGPPKLPVFNLLADIWHNAPAIIPPAVAATLINVPCQLQFPPYQKDIAGLFGVMAIKFPALTDVAYVRGLPFPQQDIVECPKGSGRYYFVNFCDDVGKGFPNEFRQVICTHGLPWPVPTP